MNASKVESGKEHCLRGMTVVNFLFVVGGKKKKKVLERKSNTLLIISNLYWHSFRDYVNIQ